MVRGSNWCAVLQCTLYTIIAMHAFLLSWSSARGLSISNAWLHNSWLTVLPIEEHAFHLHKGDFRDALSLRYGLMPLNTASTCHCGASFSVDHAMICPVTGILVLKILVPGPIFSLKILVPRTNFF